MNDICVIPARGGSKRIYKKNVRMFHGKEMIRYAIETAKNSMLFQRIIVSTDDLEISGVAHSAGAEIPFLRPAELSDDHTTTLDVVVHALSEMVSPKESYENVCCIYPCVPFLTKDDLVKSRSLIRDGSYVFPIQKSGEPYYRALNVNEHGSLSPVWEGNISKRTQDFDLPYYDAGQFYWAKSETWISRKSIHGHAIGYPVDQGRLIDIDNEEDWETAEYFYNKQNSAH